jgi:hypothetical protein
MLPKHQQHTNPVPTIRYAAGARGPSMRNFKGRGLGYRLLLVLGLAAVLVSGLCLAPGLLKAADLRGGDAAPRLVTNAADLKRALQSGAAGVIYLAPGDYADVVIRKLDAGGTLTIVSRDPKAMATMASLTITDSKAIVVRGVDVTVEPKTTAIRISNSTNVSLDGLTIHGISTPDVVGQGNGVLIRDSSEVSVVNSEFHNLANGLAHLDSDHLTFSRNQFHDLRIDAVRGGGSSNVTVRNNVFWNFFRAPKDHPDAVQFWTTNTKASAHDITVSDNLIMRGEGAPMQGIFITDQSRGRLPYENVTVSGNAIIGTMYHGINVTNGNNVTIQGNIVSGYADMKSWIMVGSVNGGLVKDNQTSSLHMNKTNSNVKEGGNKSLSLAPVGDKRAAQRWLSSRRGELSQLPQAPGLTR